MRRKPTSSLLLSCLIGACLLLGCSAPHEAVTPAAALEAISGDWVLVEPASAFITTLRIDGGTPTWVGYYGAVLTGRSAINTYSATASFSKQASMDSGKPGTGSISTVSATKVGGPAEALQFEQDYFTRLDAVTLAERIGTNKLRFTYTNAGVVKGTLLYKRP